MKSSLFTAAAFAAPIVLGSPLLINNNTTNTTTIMFIKPGIVAHFQGDCHPLCEQFRNRDNCVSNGYRNNCFDVCMSQCFMLHESDTDSPSESDLITILSEESEWNNIDPLDWNSNSSGDERTEVPCLGWCKRNDNGTVPGGAVIKTQVNDMVGRVTAYGQVYHHLYSIHNPAGSHEIIWPVGTRLDDALRSWVSGFKDRLAKGDDLQLWREDLYKRVEESNVAPGHMWAYRFELVAHKDTEKELRAMIHRLPKKQKRTAVKSVRRAWRDEFEPMAKV